MTPEGSRVEHRVLTKPRGVRFALPVAAFAVAAIAVPTAASAGADPMVIATVGVGAAPLGEAANPVTKVIYVANAGDNTVSVIPLAH